MTTNIQPLRESNDALDDPEEIRCRIAEEGYVFIRGLQDRDKLLALRHDVLSVMMDGGWLVSGTDVLDGIADISTRCTGIKSTPMSTIGPTVSNRFIAPGTGRK